MTRLHLKKQICMEGGYMLGKIVLGICMVGFYLLLCFIQWIGDVVDEKRWYVWREWFRW